MITENKSKISYIGWALFTFIVLANISTVLGALLIKRFIPEFTESTWYLITMSSLPMYLIAFPVFFGMIRKLPTEALVKKREFSKFDVVKLICICIAATYCLNIISLALTHIIELVKQSTVTNPLESLVSQSSMYAFLIYGVIAAPILEEIVFRKILLERLKPYGTKLAYLLSALAFATVHGNLSQFLYAFVLGLIFAYLADASGGIKITIIIHITINFIGSGAAQLIAASGNDILLYLFGVLVMTIFISGIIFFIKDSSKLFERKPKVDISDDEVMICQNVEKLTFKQAIFTSGMIFFLLAGLALIVTNLIM